VAADPSAPRLAVRGLTKRFGGLLAVTAATSKSNPARSVGLIGPNGSGKSTVFNLITNMLRADSGSVLHDGTPSPASSCTRWHGAESDGPSRR